MFNSISVKRFDNDLALHIYFSDKTIFDEMLRNDEEAAIFSSQTTLFFTKQVHYSEVEVLYRLLNHLGELALQRKEEDSLTMITSAQQKLFGLAHLFRDREQSQRKAKEPNKAVLFQPAKDVRHLAFNIIDRSMDSDGHSDVYYTDSSPDSSDRMTGYFVDAFGMCLREPDLLESVMRYALKNNQFQPGWAVEKMLKTDYRAKGSKLEEIYKKVKSEIEAASFYIPPMKVVM